MAISSVRFCFVALATFLLFSAPLAAEVTRFSDTFAGTLGCDEDVDLEGRWDALVHELEGGDTYHRVVQFRARGEGYGQTSGAHYAFTERYSFVINDIVPPLTYVDNWMYTLRGHGNAPNYVFRGLTKIVINANGEVVVDDFKLDEFCD